MPTSPSFQFSLLAFPQRWDGTNIQLRILALPQSNPLLPMITEYLPPPIHRPLPMESWCCAHR